MLKILDPRSDLRRYENFPGRSTPEEYGTPKQFICPSIASMGLFREDPGSTKEYVSPSRSVGPFPSSRNSRSIETPAFHLTVILYRAASRTFYPIAVRNPFGFPKGLRAKVFLTPKGTLVRSYQAFQGRKISKVISGRKHQVQKQSTVKVGPSLGLVRGLRAFCQGIIGQTYKLFFDWWQRCFGLEHLGCKQDLREAS